MDFHLKTEELFLSQKEAKDEPEPVNKKWDKQ